MSANDKLIELIASKVRGRFVANEPLHKHTTWRVGGPAQYYFKPADLSDLQLFFTLLSEPLPITWLGLGSNVLVRDGGISGVVISTQGGLGKFSQLEDGSVRAEVGLSCAQVARQCAKLNLQGGEFLAGVPGSTGGQLAMNAGCFGSETWDFIKRVEMINRQGQVILLEKEAFQIQYRQVDRPQDHWFVAGHFFFTPGDKEQGLQKIRTLLDKRALSQPTGLPCCGSVFRNPPGDYSGRLIEACGLKGFSIGGATVSDKHANFIINTEAATAKDIEQLITYVQAKVAEQFAVTLCPEVHIIGEPA